MAIKRTAILIVLLTLLVGCASHAPSMRERSSGLIQELRKDKAGARFPDEFSSLESDYRSLEELGWWRTLFSSKEKAYTPLVERGERLRELLHKIYPAAPAPPIVPEPGGSVDKAVPYQSGPLHYAVKKGESLPGIAGHQQVYGDSSLWPLLYRANRDQVRDPYQLYPGQILKIPRQFTKEEIAEARRQSQRKP